MSLLFAFDSVRNPLVGALALWEFAREFEDASAGERPFVCFALLVIPMAFHPETVEATHRRHRVGGVFKAIAENRDLPAGLEQRVRASAPLMWRSLHLGCAANLLSFDKSRGYLVGTLQKTCPVTTPAGPVRDALATAKRVGAWCATVPGPTLFSVLDVRL